MIGDHNKEENFAFSDRHVSRDWIDLFRKTTIEQRLRWLEEMNTFVRQVIPPNKFLRWQEYKQHQRLRKG